MGRIEVYRRSEPGKMVVSLKGVLPGDVCCQYEPAPPRFCDLAEVGRRLCLKKSAIYELFARGQLTRVKLSPERTVVLEAELSAFIERKHAEACAGAGEFAGA